MCVCVNHLRRAFATRDNNVGIFKDVLEKLNTSDATMQRYLSDEANDRTKALVFVRA